MIAPGTSGGAAVVETPLEFETVVTRSRPIGGHRTRHVAVVEDGECVTRLLLRHSLEGKPAVNQDVLARQERAVEQREIDVADDTCDIDLREIVTWLDGDDLARDAQAHGRSPLHRPYDHTKQYADTFPHRHSPVLWTTPRSPGQGAHMSQPMYRSALPQLSDALFLTDSGMETDLIFNGGWELPEFAAFVLLDDPAGYVALREYFLRHVAVAESFGCAVILEAPTWRASRDWGARLGYSAAQLRSANERAISLLTDIRRAHVSSPIVISGCIGPQADAYDPSFHMTPDEAERYHREQIDSLAATDADVVHAMTITYADEAIGITRAAMHANVPVVISFTTETDGRLPDGTSLAEAIATVDRATSSGPAYYGINCAHPTHFAPAFPSDGGGGRRIRS